MLIVKGRESGSVQKRLLTLIDRDCYKIVKLYGPQTEGNKDCKAHRCMDFLTFFPKTLFTLNVVLSTAPQSVYMYIIDRPL